MMRIMVQRLILGVQIVVFVASAVVLSGPTAARASTWCVAPVLPGPCASYPVARQKTTLSAVIAAPASPGDTVNIFPGTYTDQPDVSISRLLIKGVQGRDVTIFDGLNSSAAALKVSAGDVVLDGFTFTHSNPAGGAGGVGGGVDAAPPGNPSDPEQGRCYNLNRELPNQICGTSTIGGGNYVPPYLGGTSVNQCLPIVYPRDFTDASGVNPTCPHALPGAFTLRNSYVSNNWSNVTCGDTTPRCYGVKVIVRGLVTISNVEASNNGSDGNCEGNGYQTSHGPDGESCFGIMAFSVGQGGGVVMTDIKANDNRATGNCLAHETCFGIMADETLLDVKLERIETNNNGADGDCNGNDTCFGTVADGVEGKVTMIDVVAKDNGAEGSCPSTNDSCSGIIVDGEDWSLGLTMSHVVADHNGAFDGNCGGGDSCSGIEIDGHGGDIRLGDVEANDNGATGNCSGYDSCIGIDEDSADVLGVFALTNVEANRNGAGGNCSASDSCAGIIHDSGFCSGNVEFRNVEASSNGAVGNCPGRDSCQGIDIDSGDNTGSFILAGVKANDNGADQNCSSEDNCHGILIDGGGVTYDPSAPDPLAEFCPLITPRIKTFSVTLSGIQANSNGAGKDCSSSPDQCSGVVVDGVLGPISMNRVTANDNGASTGACSAPTSCSGVTAENEEAVVGAITLCQVEAERNSASGTCNSSSCYGLTATGPSDVALGSVRTIDNSGNGTVVNASGTIFINMSTSTGNGGTNLVTSKAPVDENRACGRAAPAMSLWVMVAVAVALGIAGATLARSRKKA